MPEPTTTEGRDADLRVVLDEELSHLPDHYRGVLVLCDVEGMTRKEAARQLGIPEGSVASRVARARALLAKRLARRGVVLSAGAVAALSAAGPVGASAPPALVASTIKAASLLAAGRAAGVVSAQVAALTDGVVNTMFASKIKAALAVVLVVGFVATGTTIFAGRTVAAHDGKKPAAEKRVEPATKQAKKGGETVIAWGKEVGGLQAGLGIRPGGKRDYHHGDTVTLFVRVRNVGKETVKFEYIRQFLDENRPTVTDAAGETVRQPRSPLFEGVHRPEEVSLAPGKEIELGSRLPLRYELVPAGGGARRTTERLPLVVGTGNVGLQYERVFGDSSSGSLEPDPVLSKLATGRLVLEIQAAPPAPPPARDEK